MIIYILTFLITVLLTYAVQKNKKNNAMKIICIILAIFIPSFVAGMRDITIGTDVQIYGESFFRQAVQSASFIKYYNTINTDFGYALLNFIVSRFTSDVNIFLFIMQLIINGLIFATIYGHREKSPMWFSMLIYLTVYYCTTYNYLRQSIALAIILYSTKYIEQKKLKKYLLGVIIATSFHATAIFAVILYVINVVAKRRNRIVYEMAIILIGVIVTLQINNVLQILYQMGIISERYYSYIDTFANNEGGFSLVDVIYKGMWVVIYMLFGKKLRKEEEINSCYGMCLWLDLIFFFCGTKLKYAGRIAYYFGYTTILFIPKMVEKISDNKKGNANIVYFSICCILIGYWYVKTVLYGANEVYPYTSLILGI